MKDPRKRTCPHTDRSLLQGWTRKNKSCSSTRQKAIRQKSATKRTRSRSRESESSRVNTAHDSSLCIDDPALTTQLSKSLMHSPSSAFLSYFESEFFSEKKDEFLAFQSALLRPLKKTIRINTRRIGIDELLSWLGNEGWTFTPTEIPSVFQVDREDRSIPLGSTLPHILGLFYIQEESATHSVHTLQRAYE